MRKFFIGLMGAAVLMVGTAGITTLEVKAEDVQVNEVTLTAEQMDEMATLHRLALEQKVEIIKKYVEYGVFTEEKAKEYIKHMEERYKKLEENKFIPDWEKWDKHGKHDNH